MSGQYKHTPGPLGVEADGAHHLTIGRATVENSAILRGIERRKAERAAMRAALAQADEVNATLIAALVSVLPLVDRFGDISESNAIRAAIAKATGAPA